MHKQFQLLLWVYYRITELYDVIRVCVRCPLLTAYCSVPSAQADILFFMTFKTELKKSINKDNKKKQSIVGWNVCFASLQEEGKNERKKIAHEIKVNGLMIL